MNSNYHQFSRLPKNIQETILSTIEKDFKCAKLIYEKEVKKLRLTEKAKN